MSFGGEWREEEFSFCGEWTDDFFSSSTGEGTTFGGGRLSTRGGRPSPCLEAGSTSRLSSDEPIAAATTEVSAFPFLSDFTSLVSNLSGVVRFLVLPTCAAVPSSTSSAMPPNLDRRSEEDESDVSDAAEVCSMQADAKVDSFNSEAALNEKTVSCGAKVSRID